jgi:ribulose-phosphate 3-epimerase
MAEIIPAILPRDYEDLKNKIALVRNVCKLVQVDICDGVLVKSVTWPFISKSAGGGDLLNNNLDENFIRIFNEREGMPFWEDIDFELDLMVVDAVENFDIYTKLGPKRMIFHLEAVGDLTEFKNFLEGIDNYIRDTIDFGVAISPNMDTSQVLPLVNSVDFVQVMGVDHEGLQGEDFDPKCLEHIKILKEKFPDLIISVDGGVNLETAKVLIDNGVDRLVAGSAIFHTNDIIDTMEQFREL